MKMQARQLRTEYQIAPLALSTRLPRLSWQVEDGRADARQTGFQIVASAIRENAVAGGGTLWDSGRVHSSSQSQIEYAGRALNSRETVWWSVRLWDHEGQPGPWSEPATFETGLLTAEDWKGQFVAAPCFGTGQSGSPSPLLRTSFQIGRAVQCARLYITSLGLYEAWINGRRVGEDWMRPGWTDYNKRLCYQAYDVTHLLKTGENVLGAILGDGWYCGRVGPHDRGATWGSKPALLAQLHLEYEDGTSQCVTTSGEWRWRSGPVLCSDLIDGENYDARREIAGWSDASCHAEEWATAETLPTRTDHLEAAIAPPVRALAEIAPISVQRCRPSWERDARIFDFGQNLTGVVRFKLKAPAGCTVVIRHAEVLKPDGSLDVSNLRTARQTDCYTFRGDPEGEEFCPRFTLHGFRYAEISASHDAFNRGDSWALTPTCDNVRAVVLASDTPDTGHFECNHALLNQLQSNIRWGMRGNFIEVPTDCPQRDERLGWTGDTQVFASTAAFNADVALFYTKWMRDLRDAQLPSGAVPSIVPKIGPHWDKDGESGWSDAILVVPLETYYAYGDLRILEENYSSQQQWVQYLEETSRGWIRPFGESITHRGYGDWLALDGHSTDPFQPNGTPKELIATAHFAEAFQRIATIAGILGRSADAGEYLRKRKQVVEAFNHEFVTPAGRLSAPSQTAYLLALAFDLLPEALRPVAVDRLVELIALRDWHLSTGFLGTPLLCPVLTRFGKLDVAYKLLLQETYPGWLYPVTLGATTMWERWNSWHPERGFVEVGMNSLNHYAYGAVGKWMYSVLAGLDFDPAQPGYQRAIFKPRPGGGIGNASAAINSPRGRYSIRWAMERDQLDVKVEIPANGSASLELPDGVREELAAGQHHRRCRIG